MYLLINAKTNDRHFSIKSSILASKKQNRIGRARVHTFPFAVLLPPNVKSSLGGGISVRWWLLLRLLLLGQRLLQSGAFPRVVLPVQQLLLVDELGALSVDQLLPEVFVLQQLEHVQTVRIPAGGEETGRC